MSGSTSRAAASSIPTGSPSRMARVEREEVLFRGSRCTLVRAHVTCRDGQLRPHDFLSVADAVGVIAWLDDGQLVLVRQLRPAIGRALIELPAGHLEPGESALETARRELVEETGFTASAWRPLTVFYPSCGKLSERMHLYEARGLIAGTARPEPNEDIEVVTASLPEALRLARAGEIADSKTLLALMIASGAPLEAVAGDAAS